MTSSSNNRLARAAGVFTGATMLSRILGYARDSIVAVFFGMGTEADAFYAAFRISNLFRRLLGEGALSASFIPVFSDYIEHHGQKETQRFLNLIFTTLLTILIVLTVLGIVFAPTVTYLIGPGLQDTPARFALAVTLTRYMFPFLLFVSLAALITGVLNSFHSFFLPALAPACLSIAEIVYILALAPLFAPQHQIVGLAISVTVGGFCQFFVHVPALWQKGYRLGLAWGPRDPGVRRVGKLMLPATAGISVDQINTFVDQICASYLAEGSITALYYGNRVMQLPLALFGVALSQVALPSMSASVARGEHRQVVDTLNFGLRLTLFMIAPATVGLIALGHPVVQVLFQHGKFNAAATQVTVDALIYFSIGLFAYASVKLLASAFYAYQTTRIPVAIAAICVAVNITLNLVLMKPLGVRGLALATSLASWLNALLLFMALRRKLGALGGLRLTRTFFKATTASALMFLVCKACFLFPIPMVPLSIRLFTTISVCALAYMASAWCLRMEEVQPFLTMISRRFAAEKAQA